MKKEIYIDSDGQELDVNINHNETKRFHNSKNQLHRLNGPAIEYLDGSYDWYRNGKPHRIGGPAFSDPMNNDYMWFVNDKQVEIYYICG